MNNDKFAWVDWMIREREALGWSPADLARKAEVSRTVISLYEKRKRLNPDEKTLSKIAIALKYPPEKLLRLANILPPSLEINETMEEAQQIISMYRHSSTRIQALKYLKYLQVEEEKADYHAKQTRNPAPSESG
jgi:transcriptional regulator with XRE-family HTH domain